MDKTVCETCNNTEDACVCCASCLQVTCSCCETCETYPCQCCSICGDAPWNCVCCHDCGNTEDECECAEGPSGTMGHSAKPGWVERGHADVKCIVKSDNWRKAWPEIDEKFDPVQMAADFYLLEAIVTDAPLRVTGIAPVAAMHANTEERDHDVLKSMGVTLKKDRVALIKERNARIAADRKNDPVYDLAWIIGEAEQLLDEVVDVSDATLVGYFHMAIAGEARHHRAIGGTVLAGGDYRAGAWVGWRKVYEQVGPEAIKDLAALLGEISGGTYGGKRWQQAAEILYSRVTCELGPTEAVTKRLFVDRAWTLEHNGGCFLNKIDWHCGNRKGWNLSYLKSRVLEAHAANPPQWRILMSVASDRVVDLADRYWETANRRREALGVDPIDNPRLNVATRILCRYCSSNPAFGHRAGCGAPATESFSGGDISVPRPWFRIIEEDDWMGYDWLGWTASEEKAASLYPIKADGSFELDGMCDLTANTCMTVDFGSHQQYVEFADTSKLKLFEADDHEYNLGELIANDKSVTVDINAKDGVIQGCSFNLTIAAYKNGKRIGGNLAVWHESFGAVEYYGKGKNMYPKSKLAQVLSEKVVNCMDVIRHANPHLQIVEPDADTVAAYQTQQAAKAAKIDALRKAERAQVNVQMQADFSQAKANLANVTYVLSKPKVKS